MTPRANAAATVAPIAPVVRMVFGFPVNSVEKDDRMGWNAGEVIRQQFDVEYDALINHGQTIEEITAHALPFGAQAIAMEADKSSLCRTIAVDVVKILALHNTSKAYAATKSRPAIAAGRRDYRRLEDATTKAVNAFYSAVLPLEDIYRWVHLTGKPQSEHPTRKLIDYYVGAVLRDVLSADELAVYGFTVEKVGSRGSGAKAELVLIDKAADAVLKLMDGVKKYSTADADEYLTVMNKLREISNKVEIAIAAVKEGQGLKVVA